MVGLGLLSWVATYVGMLELIEANMGELPLIHKLIIGFSVAMLMVMVVWLLDEMFKPNPFSLKAIYAAGYIFLTAISVGFGFGFYWKVLESRGESTRSAESAVTQVQGSLTAASARLTQLQQTLDQLTAVSLAKEQSERATGNSCPASKPGDGPRRKLREEDASRFAFASDFVKGRSTAVKTEMAGLDGDLLKIASADKSTIDASGTRNVFMQGMGRKLDQTVTSFNAFRTDPQLKQIRGDLAERAEKTTFPDGGGKTFSCPDGQLQTALRGVVRAIDGLPELEKPKIAAVEGSEATIEAFRRLVASFSGLLQFKLPPSADELRELQKKAIQSVESPAIAAAAARMNEQPGLSKRDYVPLAIAVFVDLCLLLVAMGRNHDRLSGLVPKMRAAERGPVIQILSRFNDIHRDRQVRENFDLFRHVVFDFHGDYYVAVPLDAPKRMNPHEREDLRLEAQLLSNLFASFEKERIFSRVYSPFLTTGTVRKRLTRQGSKFAGSDAFRLYRFKDGAWSDIILGAVMGAARRVEAEKRMLALRADEIARNTPLPDPAYSAAPYLGSVSPERNYVDPAYLEPSFLDPAFDRPTPAAHTRSTAAMSTRPAPSARMFDDRHGDVDPAAANTDFATQFGSYAAFAARAQPAPPNYSAAFGDRGGLDDLANPVAGSAGTPGVATVRPLYRPADDRDLQPANSNTASERSRDREPPSARPADPRAAGIVPFTPPVAVAPFASAAKASAALAMVSQPEPQSAAPAATQPGPRPGFQPGADWQQQLGIVMTRVTESISVPVSSAVSGAVSSQAQVPSALLAAGLMRPAAPVLIDQILDNKADQQFGSEQLTLAFEGPANESSNYESSNYERTGYESSGYERSGHPSDWTDTDTALAKRYARGAAE